MDRGAWWASIHGVAKESDMTERLKSNSGGEPRWMGWAGGLGVLIQAPLSPAFFYPLVS